LPVFWGRGTLNTVPYINSVAEKAFDTVIEHEARKGGLNPGFWKWGWKGGVL